MDARVLELQQKEAELRRQIEMIERQKMELEKTKAEIASQSIPVVDAHPVSVKHDEEAVKRSVFDFDFDELLALDEKKLENLNIHQTPKIQKNTSQLNDSLLRSSPVKAQVVERTAVEADDDFWNLSETKTKPDGAGITKTQSNSSTASSGEAKRLDKASEELARQLQAQEEAVARREEALRIQREKSDMQIASMLQSDELSRSGMEASTSRSPSSRGVMRNNSHLTGFQAVEANKSPPVFEDNYGNGAGGSSRILLTTKEIREMAEAQIGKDNVKVLSGFTVKKFGREGRPHQRKMWINSSISHLAWESGQYDGNHRGMDLSTVKGILVGQMTKNIKRATRDVNKVKELCFSLQAGDRTFDLQACSAIQRQTLVDALQKVIEFNHRHKPVRKNRQHTEITIYVD